MNIKIFISYKDRHTLIKSDILTPIQTGRAIASEIFYEMIGDDTGDNISKENTKYNELTAQYWAWKNYDKIGNPDYIGFMHYRRHFVFDSKLKFLPYTWLPKSSFHYIKQIDNNYLKSLSNDKILPHLNTHPNCIAYNKFDVFYKSFSLSIKNHWINGGMGPQKEKIIYIFEDVVKTFFPEYKSTLNTFLNGRYMYCCNSFIMHKELFFEYSQFLFKILSEIDKKVDSSTFNKKQIRFLGYLGELILSLFIMQKQLDNKFKLIELSGTYISKDYKRIKRKYIKYKIFTMLTFGKKHKYYLKKYIRTLNCMKRK